MGIASQPSFWPLSARASLYSQLLLSLSTKPLVWAGDKSGFWQTGCSEGCLDHAWTLGRLLQPSYAVRHVSSSQASRPLPPASAPSLTLQAPRLPRPQALAPRLTGHGFKAQHAVHKVREADPPGSIAVPQGHQAQELLVSGQTCGGKRNITEDALRDDGLAPMALCTLQRSWGPPSAPPPCHASSLPFPRFVHKSWGRVMENQSRCSHLLKLWLGSASRKH